MLRIALAAVLGIAVITLSGVNTTTANAQDKKDEKKTLEGKLVCGKCKLSETDACSNVLIVKDGDKEIKYYLTDKGKGEGYHKCSGEVAVKVTGKVVEKDKKMTIEGAKVEKTK